MRFLILAVMAGLWSGVTLGSQMVTIPAGFFVMGDPGYQNGGEGLTDEAPVHRAWLDAYQIDLDPVTNAEYMRCVEARACEPPRSKSSARRERYYGNPEFDRYPVVYVQWADADAYCRWAGKKLPTEAQWEKAARGAQGDRSYPWGNQIDPSFANVLQPGVKGDTSAVDAYPRNLSPYGVRGMAGNVLQWVRDWYDYDYYAISPLMNPYRATPVNEGTRIRALRGGSWALEGKFARVTARFGMKLLPGVVFASVGFRCAR